VGGEHEREKETNVGRENEREKETERSSGVVMEQNESEGARKKRCT
jgi:hypothetical protein